MKFKKISEEYNTTQYLREDGKYIISSEFRLIKGSLKNVFEVRDAQGNLLETFNKLKIAKEKYSN